jgi:threonyl-tRNA synthetase
MLIVGEKEMLENTVAVRMQGAGDQGSKSIDAFIAMIAKELA